MGNTLGLDDDFDPVDLQNALEAAFVLRFTDAEAVACHTVGDIFEVIRARLPPGPGGMQGCATAMAFHRLRRALSDLGAGTRPSLRPETRLHPPPGRSTRGMLADLHHHTGLRLPRPKAALPGQFGGWTLFAGLAWLLLTAWTNVPLWPIGAAMAVLGLLLIYADPGRMPEDCRTLGGLARKVAALNFGHLHRAGAKPRDPDLWRALLAILSDHTDLPGTEIHPETLILQERPRPI